MNDRSDPEDLGAGALGRLAVLTSEVRGLRSEIAILLGEVGRLNTAGETMVAALQRQGQVQQGLLEGLIEVHDLVGHLAALFQHPTPESEFVPVPDAAIEPESPVGNGQLSETAAPDPPQFTETANPDGSDKPAAPPYAEH